MIPYRIYVFSSRDVTTVLYIWIITKSICHIFYAYLYILPSSPLLQPQLSPEALKKPNNIVHVLNSYYRHKVKLAEKIHPQILSMNW